MIKALHSTITKHIERHFSNNKQSGDNLSKCERNALERLENRKDIVIKKAGKSGATVILDSKDYLEEGVRQLSDTSDFLRKIKDIGEIPKDAILVTMDVTGPYTNTDNTEGLEAMREALEENSQNQKPSANALTLMMILILMLNNFVFNSVNSLQKIGTALVTRAAPSYCNNFMGKFED